MESFKLAPNPTVTCVTKPGPSKAAGANGYSNKPSGFTDIAAYFHQGRDYNILKTKILEHNTVNTFQQRLFNTARYKIALLKYRSCSSCAQPMHRTGVTITPFSEKFVKYNHRTAEKDDHF